MVYILYMLFLDYDALGGIMRQIKQLFVMLLVIVGCLLICIPVFAEETKIVVGSDDVVLGTEKTISIPVNIENNPGIMGFKISVVFPNDILSLESVDQGTVTNKGNFSTKNDGANKTVILWNNTSEVLDNGSIFVLNYSVKDNSKDGKISFSYSEEDTFNENYENVPLYFESIKIIAANDSVPGNNNSSLNETTGLIDAETEQKSEYGSKIDKAVNLIEKNFSKSEILTIVENALKDVDASSVADVLPDKKETFAKDIREQLDINGTEELNELNDDELISVIEKVLDDTKQQTKNTSGEKLPVVIIVISVILLVLLTLFVRFVIKKEKKDKA